MAGSILSLNTQQPAQTVTIDGRELPLVDFYDFDAVQQHRIKSKADRYQALLGKASLNAKEEAELADIANGLFAMIVPEGQWPDEIIERLKPGHRQEIATVFFQKWAETRGGTPENGSESSPTPSQPYNDSTEAPPTDG